MNDITPPATRADIGAPQLPDWMEESIISAFSKPEAIIETGDNHFATEVYKRCTDWAKKTDKLDEPDGHAFALGEVCLTGILNVMVSFRAVVEEHQPSMTTDQKSVVGYLMLRVAERIGIQLEDEAMLAAERAAFPRGA